MPGICMSLSSLDTWRRMGSSYTYNEWVALKHAYIADRGSHRGMPETTSHAELWTRETLSVPNDFNLGNFGTRHGKRCQFGKGSIWEIFGRDVPIEIPVPLAFL